MIVTSLNASLLFFGFAATIVANVASEPREPRKNSFMHKIYSELLVEERRLDDGGFISTMPFKWKKNEKGTAHMILVDITSAPGRGDATKYFRSELEATGGFSGTGCSSTGCSGWFDVSFLDNIENLSSVVSITPSMVTTRRATINGLKCGEGSQPGACASLQIPLIRDAFPDLTGAGLTIGVLSDSFNVNLEAITRYEDDIESHDAE